MNIEKLKPWNWFKHENSETTQVPVDTRKAKRKNPSEGMASLSSDSLPAQPLLQLQKEMDRLFDDTWRSFGFMPSKTLNRFPTAFQNEFTDGNMLGVSQAQLDISANEKEYTISVNVPGFSTSDVSIEVIGNSLKIEGKKDESSESKDQHFYCMERSLGSFQ